LIIITLYFVGLVTTSLISYLFLMQLTLFSFLITSTLFVLVLAGYNLKFFGFQLEGNFVWSTILKFLSVTLASFLIPYTLLNLIVLIFIMVITDFLSFRFVGRIMIFTLIILRGVHIWAYFLVYIIPAILGGVNFLVFFILPFNTIFFTKSMLVLESLRMYLLVYLALISLRLAIVQVTSLSWIALLGINLL